MANVGQTNQVINQTLFTVKDLVWVGYGSRSGFANHKHNQES